ncbi:MAG: glycosyltransferase family 4 protein [Verrucomicrobiales bacterium]
MRVAYLFSRFPVLSQTFCVTEMLGLQMHGVDVLAASIHPPQDFIRHASILDFPFPVIYNPSGSVLGRFRQAVQESGRWPEELLRSHDDQYGAELKNRTRARNAVFFAKEFQRLGVDHVHVHFANRATHTALYLKAMTGLPFSFTAHAQDFMLDFPDRKLLRELCDAAEFVVAVSDWSRNRLAEEFPESAQKMLRIYNGINLELFQKAKAITADPTPVIFAVGRLIEFKGFHNLIDACVLLKERGVSMQCHIAGLGPLQGALEEQIRRLHLQDEVKLLGALSQEEVLSRLQRCAVFVLPSIVDAKGACDVLPTVITEAMACGRPVVSTRLVGIPEQVEHEVSGLLAEPRDVAGLADAIEFVLKNPTQASTMGQNGRARAEQFFEISKTSLELKQRLGSFPTQQATEIRHNMLMTSWPQDHKYSKLLADLCDSAWQVTLLSEHPAPPDAKVAVRWLPPSIVSEGVWLSAHGFRNKVLEAVSEDWPMPDVDPFWAARVYVGLRTLQPDFFEKDLILLHHDQLAAVAFLAKKLSHRGRILGFSFDPHQLDQAKHIGVYTQVLLVGKDTKKSNLPTCKPAAPDFRMKLKELAQAFV